MELASGIEMARKVIVAVTDAKKGAARTTAVLLFDLILERLFRKYMTPEDLAREEELDHLEE